MNIRNYLPAYLRARIATKSGKFRCNPPFADKLLRCPDCGADLCPTSERGRNRNWGCSRSIAHTRMIKEWKILDELEQLIPIQDNKKHYLEAKRLLFLIRKRYEWMGWLKIKDDKIDPNNEIRWLSKKNLEVIQKITAKRETSP